MFLFILAFSINVFMLKLYDILNFFYSIVVQIESVEEILVHSEPIQNQITLLEPGNMMENPVNLLQSSSSVFKAPTPVVISNKGLIGFFLYFINDIITNKIIIFCDSFYFRSSKFTKN
jgi:hypothetical protein